MKFEAIFNLLLFFISCLLTITFGSIAFKKRFYKTILLLFVFLTSIFVLMTIYLGNKIIASNRVIMDTIALYGLEKNITDEHFQNIKLDSKLKQELATLTDKYLENEEIYASKIEEYIPLHKEYYEGVVSIHLKRDYIKLINEQRLLIRKQIESISQLNDGIIANKDQLKIITDDLRKRNSILAQLKDSLEISGKHFAYYVPLIEKSLPVQFLKTLELSPSKISMVSIKNLQVYYIANEQMKMVTEVPFIKAYIRNRFFYEEPEEGIEVNEDNFYEILRAKIKILTNFNNNLRKTIMMLEQETEVISDSIDVISERKHEVEKENKELEKEIYQIENNYNDLDRELKNLLTDNHKYIAELSEIHEEYKKLSRKQIDYIKHIKKLRLYYVNEN